MNIAQKYVDGLKRAYYENGGEKQWNDFKKVMHGAGRGDYLIDRVFHDIQVSDGICDDLSKLCWLHFSDCVNNGGTSQLFIDFSPSAKGKKGQIVRYLHDPDELVIVADSFDEYLQMLMDDGYGFITEDNIEEWE